MPSVHIKPAPGVVLRDHNANLKRVPDEGKTVVMDPTWSRRIKDGDAVVVKPSPARHVLKMPDPVKPAEATEKKEG